MNLIGVIGNDYDSPIIEMGASREFVADRDGRLYLTINRGNYTDARGSFSARIRKEVDLTAATRADENRNPNDNSYDPFGPPGESNAGLALDAFASTRRLQPKQDRPNNRTLERTVAVQATESRGVDAGIDLRSGITVTITASGNITAGQRVESSPDGARLSAGSIFGTNRRPIPTAGVGALSVTYVKQTASRRRSSWSAARHLQHPSMDGFIC